jgi:outer membrane murein-binding lipoprotein Lpp
VWADSSGPIFSSTTNNQFAVRATGGFVFYTSASVGATLAAGSGSWTSMSDRNAKENFAPLDPQSVLAKVAALPLSTWNYKAQNPAIRHLGPMAQDFKAAFGLGETDTGITGVDADGVALAAIQGLNQKLDETRADNAALRTDNADLRARLEKLERLLQPSK